MKKFNYAALKANARQALAQSEYPHRKLALIHSGAVVVLSLLVTLMGWLCTSQMRNAGGLGGMDQRIFLKTVQGVLKTLRLLVLPFWCLGYVYTALALSKRECAAPGSLLEGFRRWSQSFRFTAMVAILILGLAFLCIQLSTSIFLATPLAQPLLEAFFTIKDQAVLAETLAEASAQFMPTIGAISIFVFLLLSYPLVLRFRFAPACLMASSREGAIKSLGKSIQLMRGKYWAMIKLDLHFWWYHLLNLLTGALLWSDMLTDYLELSLPPELAWVYPVCAAVGGLGSLALFCWRGNLVNLIYLNTCNRTPDPAPQTPPKQPWSY